MLSKQTAKMNLGQAGWTVQMNTLYNAHGQYYTKTGCCVNLNKGCSSPFGNRTSTLVAWRSIVVP